VRLVVVAPIENSDVAEKTSLIFPMLTASNVYPPPTGTMGSVRVSWPAVGFTLLAMANASLKAGLTSSKEKVAGSSGAESHLMVMVPPEVGFSGIWTVRADTNGATTARRLSLHNILGSLMRKTRELLKTT
jgi:hypothetical protein